MKYLFSNGCSFLSNNSKHNIALNAGSELASMMGLEYINYAKGGRGNDRIVATTKTFFSKNKDKIKNTFALIGWSASLRIDYLCNSFKIITTNVQLCNNNTPHFYMAFAEAPLVGSNNIPATAR